MRRVERRSAYKLAEPRGKDLLAYLRNAIENVDNPKVLIRMVRAIVERSFQMVWDRVIPNRRIPADWSYE
jgi:hypothetical protein